MNPSHDLEVPEPHYLPPLPERSTWPEDFEEPCWDDFEQPEPPDPIEEDE